MYTAAFSYCSLDSFSFTTRKNHKTIHQYSGYVYVAGLLLFSAPSGIYMGIHANGGFWAQLSFVILGCLWWFTTFMAMVKFSKRYQEPSAMDEQKLCACCFCFNPENVEGYSGLSFSAQSHGSLSDYCMARMGSQFSNHRIINTKKYKYEKLVIFGVLLSLFSCKKEAKVTSLENKKILSKQLRKRLWLRSSIRNCMVSGLSIRTTNEILMMKAERPKISIKIDRITADTVWAQSIVSGNQRPLIGKTSDQGNKISFILDEPGNRKDDGRFELFTRNDSLIGQWTAYSTTSVKSPYKNWIWFKSSLYTIPTLC